MKLKWLLAALIVLMVMNVAAIAAFFISHHHASPERSWHARGRMHSWIAREPQERRKLFRAMRSFHEDVRPLVEDTDKLEERLIAAMGDDPVSQAHIDSLLEKISRNRLEIAQRATHRMIALGDSLSPEEREHLMDMLVRMHRGPGGPEEGRWRRRH